MPRTEAGKRLMSIVDQTREAYRVEVAAIEAEAVAAERARIATAVELWPSPWFNRAEVLDIIDGEDARG